MRYVLVPSHRDSTLCMEEDCPAPPYPTREPRGWPLLTSTTPSFLFICNQDLASPAGRAHQAWDRHLRVLVRCKARPPGARLAACAVTRPISALCQRFLLPCAA